MFGLGVPNRIFNRRFRHTVSTNFRHQGRTIGACPDLPPHHSRTEIALDRNPRGVKPFGAIERGSVAYALSPPVDSVATNRDQENTAVVDAPEARLEKMYERHAYFTQGDTFNFH